MWSQHRLEETANRVPLKQACEFIQAIIVLKGGTPLDSQ